MLDRDRDGAKRSSFKIVTTDYEHGIYLDPRGDRSE